MIMIMSKNRSINPSVNPSTNPSIARDLLQQEALAGLGSELLSRARILNLATGSALFRAGEKPSRIYYVRTGEALMRRTTSAGAHLILQRATNAFLADASLTSDRYHCDGVCRTDCELIVFSVQAIRNAIDNNPETRWAWIGLLAAQSRRQRARVERMALKTVRERLHHLVLTEGDANGEYSLSGTRMELAAELGVTPEALYRTISVLRAEGVLTIFGAMLKWQR